MNEDDYEYGNEHGEDLTLLEKVQVACALIFSVCVTGGIVLLLLRGCSA